MKKGKTLINNRKELASIKAKMEEKVHATEEDFMSDFNTVSSLLKMSGIYRKKKYEHVKKDIHAMVVQFVSGYLKDFKPFGEKNDRLNHLLVPSLTLGFSLLLVNLTRRSASKSND